MGISQQTANGPGTQLAESLAAPLARSSPGETSSTAIAAREKAAIEARFVYAMRNPRDFDTSRRRLLDACRRPLFASVARYAKPVGGKDMTGLSIRFAEEARVLWGNMDVTVMLVFDDDEKRIYRVSGVDLETNATDGIDVPVEKFVERKVVKPGQEVIGRPRTTSQGGLVYKVRATEDDMMVKALGAIARAKRNVILSLLPGDVKEECEAQIIATLANADAEDPDAARRKLLDAFWRQGVTPAQIAELLGHTTEKINLAEMTVLRSYGTAIRDGEATWADILDAHGRGGTPASTGTEGGGETRAPSKGAAGFRDAVTKRSATKAADTISVEEQQEIERQAAMDADPDAR